MMIIPIPGSGQVEPISVCERNSIADISFYDSNNVISRGVLDSYNRFPFLFTEKNRQIQIKEKIYLIKHLKSGQDLPPKIYHTDWIIGIIFIAVLLYSLIRETSKGLLPDINRFFMIRRKTDQSSRNDGGFFNWEATILNLISFLIFGLFAYCVASYYDLIPLGVRGILLWLICLGIIILAATLRHVICVITGNMSGEKDVFREYLRSVYQSYRLSALFLLVVIILMSYTLFFPAKGGIISGFVVLGVMYFITVIKLTLIFLKRNISIFYLILYLCALEILPVVISVKYFTGLV